MVQNFGWQMYPIMLIGMRGHMKVVLTWTVLVFQSKTFGCTWRERISGLTLDLNVGFSLYDSESKVRLSSEIYTYLVIIHLFLYSFIHQFINLFTRLFIFSDYSYTIIGDYFFVYFFVY